MSKKQLYSLLFMAVWAVVWHYLKKAKSRKEPIAEIFARTLRWSLIAISSYIIILLAKRYWISSLFYSIFFVCMDWLLFSLLIFSIEYTAKEYTQKAKGIILLKVILAADSISMLCNAVFEHAVEYEALYYKNELYLVFQEKTLYLVHLVICYMMCIWLFWNLIQKAAKSPKLYKRKYIIACLDLFLIIALNGFFLLFRLRVDVSILFYAIAGTILYNSVFTFQPRYLLTETVGLVMNGIDEAFYIFDMDGKLMWQNKKANLLSGEAKNLYEFCEKMQLCPERLEQDTTRKRIELLQNEKQSYLEVEYCAMRDEKKRYMGCFFIFHDITSDVEHSLKQEYLAHYDQFTGIYNKYYFYEKTQERLKQDGDESYLILVSDVGQFKFVNDTFGTEVGDELIKRIAHTMRKIAPQHTIYGRMESDRFMMLIRKQDFKKSFFIKKSHEILRWNNTILPVRNYLGIYEITDRTLPIDLMCDRAIMALNMIKGSYHNTIAYYDIEYHNKMNQEQLIIGDFPRALKEEEFQIYLQPQVNHITKEIVGTEALVRWIHKDKGMIPPYDFIPILEKNGLIAELDEYVWDKACSVIKEWRDNGRMNWSISVNISPKDLYFLDIYSVLKRLVRKHGISPSSLKLELTETFFVNDVNQLIHLIEKLQAFGFKVEMDDFGSGYSSLNILKDIPVDVLKMDMKFFEYTNNKDRSAQILSAVVEMAKHLKLPVIAEGVEDSRQADYLSSIGCPHIQGYLYAKPMSIDEFEKFAKDYEYRDILLSR